MKKIILTLLLAFACLQITFAQAKPVKIVFDVSSPDTLVQQGAVRHMMLMSQAYKDSQFELVIYGPALPMSVKGKSTVEKQVTELAQNKNVSFRVCEVTMKRQNVDKASIIPAILPVPDAIIELVTKQGEGWGYIKEAH